MHVTRRRRVSRALIIVLTVTLVLGLAFWLHNIDKNRAVRAALRDRPALQPTALAVEKPAPAPLVIKTPTTKQSHAPLLIAVTTQPTVHAGSGTREAGSAKREEAEVRIKGPPTKPA